MQISRRLQLRLLLLHRAVARAGARSAAPLEELVAEVERLAADGVREVTLLGQNVNSYGRDLRAASRRRSPSCCARVDAVDGHRAHPLHEPAPQGHARGRHPRPRRAAARSASTSTCRCSRARSRDPQGDAPHLRPRALPRPRRADPRARARLRADDRHHRRLPGRDRGGLRRRRSRSSRRSATTARSRSSSRRGAGPRRRRCPTRSPHEVKVERMERLVEVVQRRARERAQRFVGRTLDVLVEGPSRTDPARLRGRSRHNKVVNFDGLAAARRARRRSRSPARRSQTLAGEESLLARAARLTPRPSAGRPPPDRCANMCSCAGTT